MTIYELLSETVFSSNQSIQCMQKNVVEEITLFYFILSHQTTTPIAELIVIVVLYNYAPGHTCIGD